MEYWEAEQNRTESPKVNLVSFYDFVHRVYYKIRL